MFRDGPSWHAQEEKNGGVNLFSLIVRNQEEGMRARIASLTVSSYTPSLMCVVRCMFIGAV